MMLDAVFSWIHFKPAFWRAFFLGSRRFALNTGVNGCYSICRNRESKALRDPLLRICSHQANPLHGFLQVQYARGRFLAFKRLYTNSILVMLCRLRLSEADIFIFKGI